MVSAVDDTRAVHAAAAESKHIVSQRCLHLHRGWSHVPRPARRRLTVIIYRTGITDAYDILSAS